MAGSTCQFPPAGLFGSLGGLSVWARQRFLDPCRGLCGGATLFRPTSGDGGGAGGGVSGRLNWYLQ